MVDHALVQRRADDIALYRQTIYAHNEQLLEEAIITMQYKVSFDIIYNSFSETF